VGFSAAVATNIIECVQNVFSKRWSSRSAAEREQTYVLICILCFRLNNNVIIIESVFFQFDFSPLVIFQKVFVSHPWKCSLLRLPEYMLHWSFVGWLVWLVLPGQHLPYSMHGNNESITIALSTLNIVLAAESPKLELVFQSRLLGSEYTASQTSRHV